MPIPIGWRRGSRGEKKLDSRVLLTSANSFTWRKGAGGGAPPALIASPIFPTAAASRRELSTDAEDNPEHKDQRERRCPRRCGPPDGRGRVHRQSRRRRQR